MGRTSGEETCTVDLVDFAKKVFQTVYGTQFVKVTLSEGLFLVEVATLVGGKLIDGRH